MENLEEELLGKWLDKKASPEEIAQLSTQYDLEELSNILKLQKQTDIRTLDSEEIWNQLEPQLEQTSGKSKIPWKLILLGFIVVFGGLMLFNKKDIIKSNPGQNLEFLFQDDSKVTLAPSSEIAYLDKDWNSKRRIKLSGQAYFEVQKGPKFTVETNDALVTVLGTAFEINEFLSRTEVKCFEGRVEVSAGNQQVVLSRNESVVINNSKLSNVILHKENKPQFLGSSISYKALKTFELKDEIKRFYNKDVVFKNIDAKTAFSGALVLNDLDKAISYIGQSMNWTYEIQKNQIIFTAIQ